VAQGIEMHVLYREDVLVGAVELAASFGPPDVDPVSGFVARSGEAVGLGEGSRGARAQ
jgi:hypothetical protein